MAKRSASLAAAVALAACAHPNAAPAPRAEVQEHFSLMTLPPNINTGIGIDEKAARAFRLWEQRLRPSALEEATNTWRDLVARDPNNQPARAALMSAYLFAAEGSLSMGDLPLALQNTLQDAVALAEETLMLSCQPPGRQVRERLPRLVELPALCSATDTPWLFWYAVALTDLAMASDVAVLLAWQKPLVALWQALIARGDPTGDARAYLGAFHARAPGFAGGNLPLAKTYLEQAMAKQKDGFRTRLWYAEYVLVPMHMRVESQQILQDIAQAGLPKDVGNLPALRLAQLRARQLLEHLDDLLWKDL